jgi:ribonuclease D
VDIILHNNDLSDGVTFKNQVAIDTEAMGLNFVRDRLCLVQITDGSGIVHLIKFSLKNIEAYKAPNLCRILIDKNILKVFHFARFDIGIIRYYLNISTWPIYCTNIASKIARTYTDSHGLKKLCSELLGIKLNKEQQCSDWSAESFSEEQLNYAANDVLYLLNIKEKLNNILKHNNRLDLAYKCFDALSSIIELDILNWDMVSIFNHH